MEQAEKWYTRKEAAVVLGVKESTLKRWAMAKIGPDFVKMGTERYADVRYPASALTRWQSQFPLTRCDTNERAEAAA